MAIVELRRTLGFISSHPLARRQRLRAFLRFASWQMKSRLAAEVVVPWLMGARLAVRRGMTGATGNVYAGLHEFADMMFLLHFLRPGDLFLDVGANVGSYTVLASRVCGATTWAFEPDPLTVEHLTRNIELNEVQAHVVVHEVALGADEADVVFTVGLDTVNHVATDGQGGGRVVRQARLDSFMGDAEPIMVKLDVEGYEHEVLKGAEDLLARPSLKAIELETVTPEMEAVLSGASFVRAYYDPYSRKLSAHPTGIAASNALFLRDPSFVAERLSRARPVEVLRAVI